MRLYCCSGGGDGSPCDDRLDEQYVSEQESGDRVRDGGESAMTKDEEPVQLKRRLCLAVGLWSDRVTTVGG